MALKEESEEELAARVLRHRLRSGDVLVPLSRHRLAAVIYLQQDSDAALVIDRLSACLRDHPKVATGPAWLVSTRVKAGDRPRDLWRRLLRARPRNGAGSSL
jgi:hypothetical protein